MGAYNTCRELFEGVEPAEAPMPKGRAGQSAFKLNSVGAQFRTQLRGLMSELNTCAPHYIRCASLRVCSQLWWPWERAGCLGC